ncbi:hypothetical protein [Haliscomenobacter sp.]|uniref:hypothetical protein n=1 Tax=Haliscomenobacter sp. TaxID=2717303 RepID=UPI003592E8C5
MVHFSSIYQKTASKNDRFLPDLPRRLRLAGERRFFLKTVYLLCAILFSFSLSAQSWGAPKKDRCIGSGRATYSARLANDAGKGWENAAKTTSIVINGVNQGTPKRTSNQGLGGMWGEWDIDDKSCLPIWGAPKKDRCIGNGIATYSARLASDAGLGWDIAAKSTTIVINGVNQGRPKRTSNQGVGGMWGEWDIKDDSCLPKWGTPKKDNCISPGIVQYSARLSTDGGMGWEAAAKSTSIVINGVNQGPPKRTSNQGAGGMWGEWDLKDNTCLPKWNTPKNDGCKGVGIVQYSARLASDGGMGWEAAAKSTSIVINGVNQGPPKRTSNQGVGGMWGEWDVKDPNCVSRVSIKSGVYYKLQFRTSANQNLCIWGNGEAGGGKKDTYDEGYDKWLFIPTGKPDEYWIFNKAARNGFGQALALPESKKNFGQWDFKDDDKRQRFRLVSEGDFVKLYNVSNNEVLSTRWDMPAFTWGDTPGDQQQQLRLVEAEPISRDDALLSYLFWNFKNETIRDYIINKCKLLPGPQALAIKELVFINGSSKKITPAIHKYGCAGAPWRNGLAQCWSRDLQPGAKDSMLVDGYLQNSKAIWSLITTATVAFVSVVATVATGGATAGVAATATAAVAGTASTLANVAKVTATVADMALFGFDLASTAIEVKDDIQGITDRKEAVLDEAGQILLSFGVEDTLTQKLIQAELGKYSFAVKGSPFENLMSEWYLEETVSQMKLDKMFYSGGKAVFVFTDFEPEGLWSEEYQKNLVEIKKTGNSLQLREIQTPGGSPVKGPYAFSSDSTIPNQFNLSGDVYKFLSDDSFELKPKGSNRVKTFNRVHDFAGTWQRNDSKGFLRITHTVNGLKSETISSKEGQVIGEARMYTRDSRNPNTYRNSEDGEYLTFSTKDELLIEPLGGKNKSSYHRVPEGK